jgi:hypothetical protein
MQRQYIAIKHLSIVYASVYYKPRKNTVQMGMFQVTLEAKECFFVKCTTTSKVIIIFKIEKNNDRVHCLTYEPEKPGIQALHIHSQHGSI